MAQQIKKNKKYHIKRGDTVVLTKSITAAKNLNLDRPKGFKGKVLRIFPKTDRVIVEGVNVRFKHTKPNQLYPQGGRIEREMPIHISNVMPADSDGNATRVGRKWLAEGDAGIGRWVRYAKTNGEELDS